MAAPKARGRRASPRDSNRPRAKGRPSAAGGPRPATASAAATPVETARVAIVSDVDADKFTLLEAALDRAGFWSHLAAQGARAGVRPADARILIKPELAVFDRGS